MTRELADVDTALVTRAADGDSRAVAEIVRALERPIYGIALRMLLEPGGLMPPPVVAWCRANLPQLEVIELGAGRHYLQEDHPHAIGTGLGSWLARLG